MKNRAKKAKPLNTALPNKRPSSAWIRGYVRQYHDAVVVPLHERLLTLEKIMAATFEAAGVSTEAPTEPILPEEATDAGA